MAYKDNLDRIIFDSKFTPSSNVDILESYEEWCIINTKLKRGDFKKLADRFKQRTGDKL